MAAKKSTLQFAQYAKTFIQSMTKDYPILASVRHKSLHKIEAQND